VVNPLLAGPTRRKTDVLDSRLLSYQDLTGLWPSSYLATPEAQTLRVLMSGRQHAKRSASQIANRLNNYVLRWGHTYGSTCKILDGVGRPILEDLLEGLTPDYPGVSPLPLPAPIRPMLRVLLEQYDVFTEQAEKYLRAAMSFARSVQWPAMAGLVDGKTVLENLQSVPGIGPVGALTWLTEVGDPRRFKHAGQVAAFCGCDPSLKISAGKVTQYIRRRGNLRLHATLLQAGMGLVTRHSEPLGEWGYTIARKHQKGGWKKAAAAVARRLSAALWWVHLLGVPFSYEKYRFNEVPVVPDMPIEAMGLGNFTKTLAALGYTNTRELAEAFVKGELAHIKGVGAKCLQSLQQWLTANRQRPQPPAPVLPTPTTPLLPSNPVSSSKAKSCAAPAARSAEATRKLSSSCTKSMATGRCSTSKTSTPAPKIPSRSGRKSRSTSRSTPSPQKRGT